MGTFCRYHLLLLPQSGTGGDADDDDDDFDCRTPSQALTSLYDSLFEVYDARDDPILVRIEPCAPKLLPSRNDNTAETISSNHWSSSSVSVIHTEDDGQTTWGCHIYWVDDETRIRQDTIQWCIWDGTDLPETVKSQIRTCTRRFDIYCDPQHAIHERMDDLMVFLRLMFHVSYVYDPIHKKFIID